YTVAKLMEAEGVYLPEDERDADAISANWSAITDMSDAREMLTGNDHVIKMIQKATAAQG
ncbi:MAG: 3-oxoacyl-ACP reductase, partial [Pseudomonadota bacterium]